mmetsp:Transcript_11043/g.34161  ORF Transcript_11043/g.34161 Transcript_11043/m.34161 type:complete len:309 (-) Transcript_11043:109-1035(-)
MAFSLCSALARRHRLHRFGLKGFATKKSHVPSAVHGASGLGAVVPAAGAGVGAFSGLASCAFGFTGSGAFDCAGAGGFTGAAVGAGVGCEDEGFFSAACGAGAAAFAGGGAVAAGLSCAGAAVFNASEECSTFGKRHRLHRLGLNGFGTNRSHVPSFVQASGSSFFAASATTCSPFPSRHLLHKFGLKGLATNASQAPSPFQSSASLAGGGVVAPDAGGVGRDVAAAGFTSGAGDGAFAAGLAAGFAAGFVTFLCSSGGSYSLRPPASSAPSWRCRPCWHVLQKSGLNGFCTKLSHGLFDDFNTSVVT